MAVEKLGKKKKKPEKKTPEFETKNAFQEAESSLEETQEPLPEIEPEKVIPKMEEKTEPEPEKNFHNPGCGAAFDGRPATCPNCGDELDYG